MNIEINSIFVTAALHCYLSWLVYEGLEQRELHLRTDF